MNGEGYLKSFDPMPVIFASWPADVIKDAFHFVDISNMELLWGY